MLKGPATILSIVGSSQQVLTQYDVNDDGTLDDAEKVALKQAITQRIIEGRDAE